MTRYAVVNHTTGEIIGYSMTNNALAQLMHFRNNGKDITRVCTYRKIQYENYLEGCIDEPKPLDCASIPADKGNAGMIIEPKQPICCEYRHKSNFFIDEYDYEEHKNQYPRFVVTMTDSIHGTEILWFTEYYEAEKYVKTFKGKHSGQNIDGFYDTSELEERLNGVKTEWSIYE